MGFYLYEVLPTAVFDSEYLWKNQWLHTGDPHLLAQGYSGISNPFAASSFPLRCVFLCHDYISWEHRMVLILSTALYLNNVTPRLVRDCCFTIVRCFMFLSFYDVLSTYIGRFIDDTDVEGGGRGLMKTV
jgi:hypothetical protein